MTLKLDRREKLLSSASSGKTYGSRVAITVLNWNGWRDTIECLESVRELNYPDYLVVVVDNGSQDDSVGRIKSWAQENLGEGHVLVEYTQTRALEGGEEEREEALECTSPKAKMVLIRNQENLGFTGGNNVAIHYALQRKCPVDYVFLLNNDATVEKDCLTHLVSVDRRADAGIVGALVFDETSRQVRFGGRASLLRQFFSPIVRWQLPPPVTHGDFWPSFFISASGVLVRSDVLKAVNSCSGEYLDTRLFMYGEELAFSFAAHEIGHRSVVAKNGIIYHKKAKSSGGAYNPLLYYYPDRNRVILANELLSVPWRMLFHMVNVPVCMARILKNLAYRRPRAARAILSALADGYSGVTGKWKHHDREVLRRAAG